MPLHDWSDDDLWTGFQLCWKVDLTREIRAKLPDGYRVYLASLPLLVGLPDGTRRPSLPIIRDFPHTPPGEWQPPPVPPDVTSFAAPFAAPQLTLLVDYEETLVSVVEIVSHVDKLPPPGISPADKLLGYLRHEVNVVVVDVVPPVEGAVTDELVERLGLPFDRPGGRAALSIQVDSWSWKESPKLDVWRRPLVVGRPLPPVVLPLNTHQMVVIELEEAYRKAAEMCYRA